MQEAALAMHLLGQALDASLPYGDAAVATLAELTASLAILSRVG